MSKTQKMDYNLIEEEKNAIDLNMQAIINSVTNMKTAFDDIFTNDYWLGKKSELCEESLNSFWAKGPDSQNVIDKLELDRINMIAFINDAISKTKGVDEAQKIKEDIIGKASSVASIVGSSFGVKIFEDVSDDSPAGSASLKNLSDDWVSPYRLYNYAEHDPGQKNQRAVYSYLINDMGLTEAGAAAVMANMAHEMYFDTDWEIKDTNGKVSGGLCAWNAGRYTNLQNYCKKKNLDYKSVEGQMSYLEYELSTEPKYKEVYSALKTAKTEEDARAAARLFCIKFEVPADKYNKGNARGASAVKLLNSFK